MKEETEYKIKVVVNGDRPDFRLFGSFLWDDKHNYDSDGDSYNPASRTWTELYMSSREFENQTFQIYQDEGNPLLFEVTSENELIANRVAYFLAKETYGQINSQSKDQINFDFLSDKLGNDFDLSLALQRAELSIWRKSTLLKPYPNLINGK